MKLLLNEDNLIIHIGKIIEFGIWDEPDVEKWKIDNYYAIDYSYTVIEVESLPIDIVPHKYYYINNEFVLNTNFKDVTDVEQQISDLQKENADLKLQVLSMADVVDYLLLSSLGGE